MEPLIGTAVWGAITGTLSDQLDLQAGLDGKAALVHGHTWNQISSVELLTPPTALHAGTTDLNTLAQPDDVGFYYQPSNANTAGNNYPNGHAGSLLVQRSANSGAYGATQFYITYPPTGNEMFFRSGYGSLSPWRQVWHSGNITPLANVENLSVGALSGARVTTASGYIEFGPNNTSWGHIYTDRPEFYFNKQLTVLGKKVVTGSYILQNGSVTLGANHVNAIVHHSNTTNYIYTLPSGTAAFRIGDSFQVHTEGTGTTTLRGSTNSQTMKRFKGDGAVVASGTADIVLPRSSIATVVKVAASTWHVYGGGVP